MRAPQKDSIVEVELIVSLLKGCPTNGVIEQQRNVADLAFKAIHISSWILSNTSQKANELVCTMCLCIPSFVLCELLSLKTICLESVD